MRTYEHYFYILPTGFHLCINTVIRFHQTKCDVTGQNQALVIFSQNMTFY